MEDPKNASIPKVALAISIILFLLIAGIVYWNFDQREETLPFDDSEEEEVVEKEETGFLSYQSEELDFEINYPKDWVVEEHFDDPVYPRVNFYPSGQQFDQPITHHSDITHVSIFPEGIPTEGIFGESRPSTLDFIESVRLANDFYLQDGTAWATFVGFENMPESWGQSGFVFARVRIQNLETSCFRGEEELSQDECDPLTGDQVVRSGVIDGEAREMQGQMLESFQFTE